MLNLDRTINLKENKTFQDLIISNKLDLSDKNLNLTSLKLESDFILDSDSDKDLHSIGEKNAKNKNNENIKYLKLLFFI